MTRSYRYGTGQLPAQAGGAPVSLSWAHRVNPRQWRKEVYRARAGTSGVVIGRQDAATVARTKGMYAAAELTFVPNKLTFVPDKSGSAG